MCLSFSYERVYIFVHFFLRLLLGIYLYTVYMEFLFLSFYWLFNYQDEYPGESPWSFTLKRLGYEPLPYFTNNGPTLKYKFLNELDFVVEPGVDMRLHALSDNSSIWGYFKFSVCSSGTVAFYLPLYLYYYHNHHNSYYYYFYYFYLVL